LVGCGAGEFAAPFAGARPGGAVCVAFVAGLAGGQDALVADGHEAGKPEHEGGEVGLADPPPVDAGGGGVLDGGVESFGGGAPLAGEPPGL